MSNTAKNLEIARKGVEIPKDFLERDTRLVVSRYAKQVANRVAFVETFGKKGEVITSRINALHKSSKDALKAGDLRLSKQLSESSRLLKQLFSASTNKIEIDPSYNWKTPTARKFWGDIVDFQIGTKIGLGFATIPNITQTFISTAIRTGYKPLAQSLYNLSLNPVMDRDWET